MKNKKYNIFDEAVKEWSFKSRFYYKIELFKTKIMLKIDDFIENINN